MACKIGPTFISQAKPTKSYLSEDGQPLEKSAIHHQSLSTVLNRCPLSLSLIINSRKTHEVKSSEHVE